ncbi:hypothetical protein V6N13_073829 [Hibiscus sabdariffa]
MWPSILIGFGPRIYSAANSQLFGGENKDFSSSFHNGKSLFLIEVLMIVQHFSKSSRSWLKKMGHNVVLVECNCLELLANEGLDNPKSAATTIELPPIEGPGSPRSTTTAIELPQIEEHGSPS